MMNHYLDELLINGHRILLFQGPIGYFFTDLSHWLKSFDKIVYKLNFNGGDEYFYPEEIYNTISYQESITRLYLYLHDFVEMHQIDTFICFGDNRNYHKVAKKVANELGLKFWVFEEGYFRPDYITLEEKGVNAFSPIPRDPDYFLKVARNLPAPRKPDKLASGFLPMAKLAIQYYSKAYLGRKRYAKYQHHRYLNLKYYIQLWVKSGIKRLCYYLKDRNFSKRVENGEFGRFFIVPLQVYDDSQVKVHCDFDTVRNFLEMVLDSFANNADKTTNLIVKHHPMDRGFIDYQAVIDDYIAQYPHLANRIFYIHDVPMPVLLRDGQGMITINSTSGISALLHNMPVITLGRANYDIKGLTFQGSLDDFWVNPTPPNAELFEAYRKFHLHKTHINGSFYKKTHLDYPCRT